MNKFRKNNSKNTSSKRGLWASLCLLLFSLLVLFYPKRNKIKKIAKTNKDKFAEIIEQECKSVRQETKSLFKRTMSLAKDVFIPHPGNDHRPHALSTRALKTYAVLLILIKVVVVGFLFFTYPSPAILSQKIANQVFSLTNQSRQEAGVGELVWNDYLTQSAQAKADDMVSKGYFSHIGPDGKQPYQWIDKGNYRYQYMGENLAMDFTTAEIVHSAFAKSPTHWKNIINPKYKDMGIGVAVGEIDGRETIVLVEFFGAQPAPSSLAIATAQAAEKPVVTNPEPVVDKPQKEAAEKEIIPSPPAEEIVAAEPEPQVETEDVPTIEESSQADVNEVVTTGEEVATVEDVPVEGTGEKLTAEIIIPQDYSVNDNLGAVTLTNSDIDKGLVDYVILISRYAFLLALVALMMLLLINVVIKPHIQHSAVIVQTLALLVLLSTFIFVRFHFLETLPTVLLL